MEDNIRSELFSIRTNAGNRTYFFDVKESTDGTRYLVVSESRQNEAGRYNHHRVMVVEEHLQKFYRAMTEVIDRLQQLRETTKAYSVGSIRKDYPMAYAKWTPEDDRRLWALHQSGCSLKELSAKFNRKPGAIDSRLRKLSLEAIDLDSQSTADSSVRVQHTGQHHAQTHGKEAGEFNLPF